MPVGAFVYRAAVGPIQLGSRSMRKNILDLKTM